MNTTSRRRSAAILGLTAVLGLGLTACSGAATENGASGATAAAEDQLTLGMINSANNEWGTCMQGGVEDAAEEAGVELFTASSDADAAQEVANMEDMVSRDVDAILMNPVSVDALGGNIQRAQAADIPMYMIAVMPQDGLENVLGATVVDLPGVGAQVAGWIAENAGGEDASVAVIAGAPGASSDLTAQGFEEALPDNVSLVANQPGMYNRAEAQTVAANIVQAHPDLDYAFVLNEDMAFGARNAFDAAGREDLQIVTQNGTEEGLAAIESGDFSATIADSAWNLGATSVEQALEQLEDPSGEKLDQMETQLITADNTDEAIPFCG